MGLWKWISGGDSQSQDKPASQSSSTYGDSSLDFLDPTLKSYYDANKPDTPLSLAPREVQETYAKEQEQIQRDTVQDRGDPEHGLVSKPAHEVDGKGQRRVSIQRAARDNCVELEVMQANCLKKGSWLSGMGICMTERRHFRRCVELQEQALEMLGYAKAFDAAQRAHIQGRVDDLFGAVVPDGTVSNERVELFRKKLEDETGKEVIWRVPE